METSGIEPSLICDNCCHLERAPFAPGDTHHCGGNFLELEKVPYRIAELKAANLALLEHNTELTEQGQADSLIRAEKAEVERDKLKEQALHHNTICEGLENHAKRVGEKADRLQESLDTLSGYTTHGVSCHIRGGGPGACTCGLDAALEVSDG